MNNYLSNWMRVGKALGIFLVTIPVGIVTLLSDGILGKNSMNVTVTNTKTGEKNVF